MTSDIKRCSLSVQQELDPMGKGSSPMSPRIRVDNGAVSPSNLLRKKLTIEALSVVAGRKRTKEKTNGWENARRRRRQRKIWWGREWRRTCESHERGWEKIQLHRNNAASEKHGRVSKVPWHKKRGGGSGGKRSSRIGLRWNDTREKSRKRKRRGRAWSACAEEEEVPRVASRHKRLYDRRSSDRWKLLKPLGISRHTVPFARSYPAGRCTLTKRPRIYRLAIHSLSSERRTMDVSCLHEAGQRTMRDSQFRYSYRVSCISRGRVDSSRSSIVIHHSRWFRQRSGVSTKPKVGVKHYESIRSWSFVYRAALCERNYESRIVWKGCIFDESTNLHCGSRTANPRIANRAYRSTSSKRCLKSWRRMKEPPVIV